MNKVWDYPTAFTSWGDEEDGAIRRVLGSKRFTMGDEVAAFERELAAYHGVKHAVMVNSGSSANLIAIAAMFYVDKDPLRRGDRVAVPALAWPTLYAPLVQYGLKLVVIDCDETWNIAPPTISVLNDCAAIVVAPILGNPPDMTWWKDAADRAGATLIEDNCESLGARHRGKLCGTFGRMGTLSFFYSHQLSAIEGGAIITDDDECADLCRMLRNHGWARGVDQRPGFAAEYDFRLMGYNVRPVEMHAAIAREQLKKINRFGLARNRNWVLFLDRTYGLPITFPQVIPLSTVSPFGMAFMVKDAVTRARLAVAFREHGIDCRPPVGGSLRKHPYGEPWKDQSTPNADRIHETGLFIGNGPFDIGDRIDRAAKIMEQVL